jgi:hypothetical protein
MLGIFVVFFGNLLAIWHIFPRFGILHPEKSGNPASEECYFADTR